MTTIYKYPFVTTDEFSLRMPAGAEILSVQTQNEVPCMWAKVNNGNVFRERKFAVYGTGHPIPDDELDRMEFIGTYQLRGGELIFHLFEIVEVD